MRFKTLSKTLLLQECMAGHYRFLCWPNVKTTKKSCPSKHFLLWYTWFRHLWRTSSNIITYFFRLLFNSVGQCFQKPHGGKHWLAQYPINLYPSFQLCPTSARGKKKKKRGKLWNEVSLFIAGSRWEISEGGKNHIILPKTNPNKARLS